MDRRTFLLHTLILSAGSAVMPGKLFQRSDLVNEFIPLRRNVGAFTGRGGTIGWLADQNTILLVDSQFPNSARTFHDGIRDYSSQSIDYLINTHHHSDHTAGNQYFDDLVENIVAHENVPVLQRQVAEDRNTLDQQVLPDLTFTNRWRHDTGDEIVHAIHYGPAHTSGDAVIVFEKANIIHMGDLVFNRWYPFIDTDAGASIRNWIATLNQVLEESQRDTIFIFGHGSSNHGVTGNRDDMIVMHDYLLHLLEFVESKLAEDTPLEEFVQQQSFREFPDHMSPGSRLSLQANIEAAWKELSQ